MKLLIDTATKDLIVALYDKDQLIDIVTREGHNDHSKTLMVEISQMTERHGLKPTDITEIIVGEGPGTYTGVRIGVTVAKTMAYLLNIPLYSVSTLELIASTVSANPVAVMIDAKRQYVFGCVYDKKLKKYLVEPKFIQIEQMKELLHGEQIVSLLNQNIDLSDVQVKPVEDVHLFTPNYLREWGE